MVFLLLSSLSVIRLLGYSNLVSHRLRSGREKAENGNLLILLRMHNGETMFWSLCFGCVSRSRFQDFLSILVVEPRKRRQVNEAQWDAIAIILNFSVVDVKSSLCRSVCFFGVSSLCESNHDRIKYPMSLFSRQVVAWRSTARLARTNHVWRNCDIPSRSYQSISHDEQSSGSKIKTIDRAQRFIVINICPKSRNRIAIKMRKMKLKQIVRVTLIKIIRALSSDMSKDEWSCVW